MTRSRRLAIAAAFLVAGAAGTPAFAGSGDGGISPSGTETKSAGSAKGTFPIIGRHTYGDGLGAGRGHQGQDLMAKCGKRVVAAKSGRVRVVDYQASGAGHYVVVKGKDRRYDYVYMHLLRRVAVRDGERVRAGDRIGSVGSTGRSTACHLHFEMWRSPGWYRGGNVVDPKPFLKAWDRRS
jgi:murein DD-endopeptidase MepM/ murein hydrolase activator NlpD